MTRPHGTRKFISRSDPPAQWTGALKGHAFVALSRNYLVVLDHAVAPDQVGDHVEPCRAIRQAEVGAAAPYCMRLRAACPLHRAVDASMGPKPTSSTISPHSGCSAGPAASSEANGNEQEGTLSLWAGPGGPSERHGPERRKRSLPVFRRAFPRFVLACNGRLLRDQRFTSYTLVVLLLASHVTRPFCTMCA